VVSRSPREMGRRSERESWREGVGRKRWRWVGDAVPVEKDGDGSGQGCRSSGDDGLRGPDEGEGGRQSVGGGGDSGEGRIWEIGEIFF
jgi:hypothetical protein